MQASRTISVTKNAGMAMICQVINICLSFVSRTYFIKYLGAEYLGVNGLFSNVLTILSFAELGIGNAIVYSMYKPLAIRDTSKINSLLSLYKKTYRVLAGIVLILGLLYVPFINVSIKTPPNIPENLILIYLLFLFNTVSSYLVVFKKSVLIADQKNYIVLAATEITHIIQIISQILVLIFLKSFILFLVLQVVFTLLGNVICALWANKQYPFIKEQPLPLEKEERDGIFKNIKAMAAYKFGSIALNGTDNIIISAILGVTPVGFVSNYVLLYQACNSILGGVMSSFTASLGNLNVVGTREQNYRIFKTVLFITVWLYGFASSALFFLSQELIPLWIGGQFLLDNWTVLAIFFGFYVFGVQTCESHYRSTMGLFVQGRWAPIGSAIMNITLSIVLGLKVGLVGIFIATPISRFMFISVVDTVVIFTKGFKKNPLEYFGFNILYLLIIVIISIISYYSISFIHISGWFGFILKVIVYSIVFNGLMLIAFHRSMMFREVISKIKYVLRIQ